MPGTQLALRRARERRARLRGKLSWSLWPGELVADANGGERKECHRNGKERRGKNWLASLSPFSTLHSPPSTLSLHLHASRPTTVQHMTMSLWPFLLSLSELSRNLWAPPSRCNRIWWPKRVVNVRKLPSSWPAATELSASPVSSGGANDSNQFSAAAAFWLRDRMTE